VYQVACSLVVIIVVLAGAQQRADAKFVFTEYYNGTGFTCDCAVYIVLLGMLSTLFTFSGYEAGGHLAEETVGSRTAAPRAMVVTCVVGAITGFVYILGLLFASPGSVDYLINGPPDFNSTSNTTSSPLALTNLFVYAVGDTGALGLLSIITILTFFAGISSTTVTSRITFAMVRDGAIPGSSWFYQVTETTKSPLRCIFLVFLVDAVLILIQLGNSTAYTAILACTTIGYQLSYAIPIWERITSARKTFKQDAWNLGRFSIPCGIISATWLTFSSLIFLLPTEGPDVNVTNMNYSIVIIAIFVIIAGIYWIVYARFHFVGPPRSDVPIKKENTENEDSSLIRGQKS